MVFCKERRGFRISMGNHPTPEICKLCHFSKYYNAELSLKKIPASPPLLRSFFVMLIAKVSEVYNFATILFRLTPV